MDWGTPLRFFIWMRASLGFPRNFKSPYLLYPTSPVLSLQPRWVLVGRVIGKIRTRSYMDDYRVSQDLSKFSAGFGSFPTVFFEHT